MVASYFLSRTLVADHGDVSAEGASQRRQTPRPTAIRWSGSSAAFERGFERFRASYTPDARPHWSRAGRFFMPGVPAGLHRGVRPGALARAGFLPELRQRPVHPASARQIRHPHRGNRAAGATRWSRPSGRRSRRHEVDDILDNIGLPYSGINLHTRDLGPDRRRRRRYPGLAQAKTTRPTADYVRAAAHELPREFPATTFSFLPADIITQILNFGLPAPIDIQIDGDRHRPQPRRRQQDPERRSAMCRAASTCASSRPSTIRC